MAPLLPFTGLFSVLPAALFALTGYTFPSAGLASRASKRQKEIRKAMPDTMDLLTISVEAGLGFDAALAQVVKNVPGPLSEEIARMLQEMQIGVSRTEAFRHVNDRTEVPELDGFVLSMIQADKYGVGVAKVLRAQSTELRQKRRQRAEEVAQKVPLKLLFPMIFMVLPAMFIVILGPGAIKVYRDLLRDVERVRHGALAPRPRRARDEPVRDVARSLRPRSGRRRGFRHGRPSGRPLPAPPGSPPPPGPSSCGSSDAGRDEVHDALDRNDVGLAEA